VESQQQVSVATQHPRQVSTLPSVFWCFILWQAVAVAGFQAIANCLTFALSGVVSAVVVQQDSKFGLVQQVQPSLQIVNIH
jgi:hypothetical protein